MSLSPESLLLQPLRLGAWELPNRVVMAPLTRCRASAGRVPNALMAEYYAQRAGAGLIVSEATSVSPQGVGYPDTPGIWSDEQVDGWRRVTDAVHREGGRIVLQLWHVGRISDPIYLDGNPPVAPSAIRPAGHVSLLRPKRDFATPRALELDEIPAIVSDYGKAAANAKLAGFDGVEIHGANGYLPDQFLQDRTNRRNDRYGGSVENRARFMLEIVDAAVEVWGADRVGLHLSPRCDSHDMGDSDPAATFGHVAEEAGRRKLAFLFIREGVVFPTPDGGPGEEAGEEAQLEALGEERLMPRMRRLFGGPVVANMNLTPFVAGRMIAEGEADAASWGRQFIANPDLPARLAKGAALNRPNPQTFYPIGLEDPAEGYTDYPSLAEA